MNRPSERPRLFFANQGARVVDRDSQANHPNVERRHAERRVVRPGGDRKKGGAGAGAGSGSGSGGGGPTAPLEWCVAALGLLLLLSTIGYLLGVAARRPDAPPDVTVQVESITPVRNGYLVEIRIANRGSETAQSLNVSGTVERPGGEPESSSATFDYVPARSERRGGLFFQTDPRGGMLEVRVEGYQGPG